jgi:serine/threonine-protein kinase
MPWSCVRYARRNLRELCAVDPVVRWLVLAFALLALVAGCGRDLDEGPVVLDRWTFVEGDRVEAVSLPAKLAIPRHETRFLLRRKVDLPAEASWRSGATLVITSLEAPVTLRIDGAPIAPWSGRLRSRTRGDGPHAWSIPADVAARGSFALELEVHSTWAHAGWIERAPRLHRGDDAGVLYTLVRAAREYAAPAGAFTLLSSGILYLLLFLHERRRVANGWFAAQLLAAATYPCFVWQVFEPLLGHREIDTCGFSLVVAIYVSMRFVQLECDVAPPSRLWGASLVGVFVLTAPGFGGFWSPEIMRYVALVIVACGSLRQIVRLAQRLGRPDTRELTRIQLVCWCLLGIGVLPDCVYWTGFGDPLGGIRTGPIGLTGFALTQTFAVSRSYLRSLERADRLNEDLAGKVDDLEHREVEMQRLAAELQRQVQLRSHELAEALARLAANGAAALELKPGRVVDGRFRVTRLLGQGGMGAVYEVEQIPTGESFAMKLLTGEHDLVRLARFAREAKLAAALAHPNVVRVHDAAVSSDGFMYIVLQFVGGGSLADHRQRWGDLRWSCSVLAGAARGLQAIHGQGIVHRDLKPANVLIERPDGEFACGVRISDFGISRIDDRASSVISVLPPSTVEPTVESPRKANPGKDGVPASSRTGSLTETGDLVGTIPYMAPELIGDAAAASPASDIHAFGVMAFEILTGERPFQPDEVFARALGTMPIERSFRSAVPALDPELASVLDRTLAVEPADRPTAGELACAFESAPPRALAS